MRLHLKMISKLLRLFCFAGIMAILVGATGCCAPIKYNPALKGKVVDRDTGEPIPGTVIMRVWNKRYATLAGGHGEYYDARETVADKNGEFKIPGKGLMFFTNVTKGGAYVFRAGYNWLGIDNEYLSENGGIVKLLKIDHDKALMRKRYPPEPSGPQEKKKAYRKELDKLRIMIWGSK